MAASTQPTTSTTTKLFHDKTLLEEIYDPISEKAQFILFRNGSREIVTTYKDPTNGNIYVPFVDDFIRKGLVLLPTEYIENVTIPMIYECMDDVISEYLDICDVYKHLLKMYAVLTSVYEGFSRVPYLRIMGEFGSGKTRVSDVMRAISYHPIYLGSASRQGNISRALKPYEIGTVFIEEGNFKDTSKSSELIQVLLEGNARGGTITRQKSSTYEREGLPVYCTKVIVNSEGFADKALQSRMLNVSMRPTHKMTIPTEFPDQLYWDKAMHIRNLLVSYRADFLRREIPKPQLSGLENESPRMREIISPLIWAQGLKEVPAEIFELIDMQNHRSGQRMTRDPDAILTRIMLDYLKAGTTTVQSTTFASIFSREASYSISPYKMGQRLEFLGAEKGRNSEGYYFDFTKVDQSFLNQRYQYAQKEEVLSDPEVR
jgi:hypothetical protein